MGFKYLIVLVLLFVILNPTECWSLRKKLRKLGRKIKKTAKKIGSGIKKTVKKIVAPIKKAGCKLLFGIVCPWAVGAAGTALGAGSGGTAGFIVGAAVVIGTRRCHVKKRSCKRSVENGVDVLAFSDDFRDYDMNGDKLIEYEEFIFTVMRTVGLAEPLELREPFNFADFNKDGKLTPKEFNAAPFFFAHAYFHQFIQDDTPGTSPSLDVSTAA